uniref:Uncharacterized protein n=1 Tax=Caenorhabditis japonica TaxID=281687 RepID=A0A8R1ETF6_CAEJA
MIEIKHDKDIEDEPMDTSEARVGEEPGSEVPAAQSSGLRPTTAAGSDESPADESEFSPVDPSLVLENIICDGVNPLIDEAKLLEEGVEDVPPISEEMEKELLGGRSPQQGGPAALQPVPEPKTPKHHLPTLEESHPLAEFYGGLGDEELPANPIRRMIASLSLDVIQKGRNMTIAAITEDQVIIKRPFREVRHMPDQFMHTLDKDAEVLLAVIVRDLGTGFLLSPARRVRDYVSENFFEIKF